MRVNQLCPSAVSHICVPQLTYQPTLPINLSTNQPTNESLVYSILNQFKKAAASKVHRPSIICINSFCPISQKKVLSAQRSASYWPCFNRATYFCIERNYFCCDCMECWASHATEKQVSRRSPSKISLLFSNQNVKFSFHKLPITAVWQRLDRFCSFIEIAVK